MAARTGKRRRSSDQTTRTSRPRTDLSSYGYVEGISFVPEGLGWLIESRGTFYSTTDGGFSWSDDTKFQEPEIVFGSSVWRVDARLGFALMYRGEMVLHRTEDGGLTLNRITAFRSPG